MESADALVQTEGENKIIPDDAPSDPIQRGRDTTTGESAPANDLESASTPNEDWGTDVTEPTERQT